MRPVIQIAATLDRANRKKDRSLTLSFTTNSEIDTKEFSLIDTYAGNSGWLLFSENQLSDEDVPDEDLSYLVEGTGEFDQYITDLNWAQHFALLNREEMMDRLIKDFEYFVGSLVEETDRINCHHNFTRKENHMGRNVWLSRKGAIQADIGRLGLIPGSMGTASYVVEGLGNVMSFSSSPHGAGRVWARRKASKHFTLDDLDKAMVGIEYNRSEAFLDEIPAAYKDIDVVMKDAEDLVRIKHTLHQIVNVKGD